MFTDFTLWLTLISSAAGAMAAMYYRKAIIHNNIYLGVVALLNLAGNAVCHIIGQVLHRHNIWFIDLYLIADALVVILAINRFLSDKLPLYVIVVAMLLVSAIIGVDYFLINGNNHFCDWATTGHSLVLTAVAVYALYDLAKHPPAVTYPQSSFFVFAVGVFIYSAGTVFLFATYSLLPQARTWWAIQNVLGVVFILILINSMVCLNRQRKQ